MNLRIVWAATLCAAAISAQQALPAPHEGLEPSLALVTPYRVAMLAGEAGRTYTLFVGLDRGRIPIAPGVELGIVPLAVVQSGMLDLQGYAYAAIDPHTANAVGLDVLFQAVMWPPIPSIPYPDLATTVETLTLAPYQTEPPAELPPERLWVDDRTTDLAPTVTRLEVDGIPPLAKVAVDVVAPTTGFRLAVDAVLHAGAFTRVLVTAERPGPGELVGLQLEELRAVATLGFWAEWVEVVVVERTRPGVGDATPTQPAPLPTGGNG